MRGARCGRRRAGGRRRCTRGSPRPSRARRCREGRCPERRCRERRAPASPSAARVPMRRACHCTPGSGRRAAAHGACERVNRRVRGALGWVRCARVCTVHWVRKPGGLACAHACRLAPRTCGERSAASLYTPPSCAANSCAIAGAVLCLWILLGAAASDIPPAGKRVKCSGKSNTCFIQLFTTIAPR